MHYFSPPLLRAPAIPENTTHVDALCAQLGTKRDPYRHGHHGTTTYACRVAMHLLTRMTQSNLPVAQRPRGLAVVTQRTRGLLVLDNASTYPVPGTPLATWMVYFPGDMALTLLRAHVDVRGAEALEAQLGKGNQWSLTPACERLATSSDGLEDVTHHLADMLGVARCVVGNGVAVVPRQISGYRGRAIETLTHTDILTDLHYGRAWMSGPRAGVAGIHYEAPTPGPYGWDPALVPRPTDRITWVPRTLQWDVPQAEHRRRLAAAASLIPLSPSDQEVVRRSG